MQSITTKYIGPTNTRGSRIKATTAGGSTLTIPYCHASGHGSHAMAAIQLARKLGWTGTLVEGCTATGRVFVFETGEKFAI
jgi:hypothetical protein